MTALHLATTNARPVDILEQLSALRPKRHDPQVFPFLRVPAVIVEDAAAEIRRLRDRVSEMEARNGR